MGFRSFLTGFVKRKVTNMFEEWQDEETKKTLKEQGEKINKVVSIGGGISQGLGALGIMRKQTAFAAGQAKFYSELEFQLDKAFSPLTNELRYFQGQLEAQWGDFYYRNRLGGAIGTGIGQAGGFIAGFYLPGGPLLWSTLFGVAGGLIGTIIQEGIGAGGGEYWQDYPEQGPEGGYPAPPAPPNLWESAPAVYGQGSAAVPTSGGSGSFYQIDNIKNLANRYHWV